jgi:hypothetical protein
VLCRVGEVPVFTLVVVAPRVGWLCPPVVSDNAGLVLPTQKPDNAGGLRESPPDTTIQILHMSNKILVTLDNQNKVTHLNEVGGESLGSSKGTGAEGVMRGLASRPSPP